MTTVNLAEQLFRREFIDRQMPGYRCNPAELSFGKKLVERLGLTAERAKKAPPRRLRYAS